MASCDRAHQQWVYNSVYVIGAEGLLRGFPMSAQTSKAASIHNQFMHQMQDKTLLTSASANTPALPPHLQLA